MKGRGKNVCKTWKITLPLIRNLIGDSFRKTPIENVRRHQEVYITLEK
jgi:hypothetical protein